jgi:chromosome segregation ATPase
MTGGVFMGRKGITQTQVYEAASALLDEGTSPTVQSVRERIGSGSYTTINAHLGEWRKEHAGQAPADIPDIPEKVQGAFRQVWSAASLAAQADVETQRQALEAMRREMDKERVDMTAEIDRLETALEEATQREGRSAQDLEAARQAGAGKDARISALTVENARFEERLKAADARGGELTEQLERLQAAFTAAAKAPTSRAGQRPGAAASRKGR